MRQSHQKSRSRGRNRKPQNPMSRNYESNGPDVKIRGNAGHIADKYSSLARDALSCADTVMSENYFQHAEHYNRIIASAQAQQRSDDNQHVNGRGPQPEITENAEDGSENARAKRAENSDASNSDNDAPSDEQPDKPERKSNRGRRTKRVAADSPSDSDSESDDAEANASDSKTVKNGRTAKSRKTDDEKPTIDPEVISDDAAKLPGSITGAAIAEEG